MEIHFFNKYVRRPTIQFFLNNEDIPNGSIIQNGNLKARDLTKAKIKWKVGNGDDILFWHDNWLIQGPLINNPIFENWSNICIRQFGLKVSDYRTDQGQRDLSFISDDLKPVMIMLNSMIINNKRDELIWGDNPNGCYSVASGYNSLWSLNEKPPLG